MREYPLTSSSSSVDAALSHSFAHNSRDSLSLSLSTLSLSRDSLSLSRDSLETLSLSLSRLSLSRDSLSRLSLSRLSLSLETLSLSRLSLSRDSLSRLSRDSLSLAFSRDSALSLCLCLSLSRERERKREKERGRARERVREYSSLQRGRRHKGSPNAKSNATTFSNPLVHSQALASACRSHGLLVFSLRVCLPSSFRCYCFISTFAFSTPSLPPSLPPSLCFRTAVVGEGGDVKT